MIIEDYCSFELSKLLKEKGFDLHDTKELYVAYKVGYCVINNPYTKHYLTDEFPKATHQIALKWLREIHKYLIVIGNKNGNYLYLIKDLKANKDLGISNNEYIHYEGAVEAALKYCLTNLI